MFASGTTSYTLTVSNAATTATPMVNQASATVTVNGTAVASGAASASIPLAVGNTAISIVVTAQDGSTTQTYTVTVSRVISLELLDPTPGTTNQFGARVVQLANGNIVVSDPGDSSVATGNGAVHLYSPFFPTPIASIYGDVANDILGSGSITALGNDNYVIASPFDDEGGIVDAGSVRLVNGSTGVQIGATLAGDVANDRLGRDSITVLSNNNYVIVSPFDDEGGIVDAGSVRLVNGSTGVQIGATLAGDVAGDVLGSTGITVLGNNNYVITSQADDEGGIVDAGSVRLVNGSTGVQIGATLAGDVMFDRFGSNSITALDNNNYVIASQLDDEDGIVNAGSVRLVNGSTGVQTGATLAGDVTNDFFGSTDITVLGNNNYVIASPDDDEGGIVDAGSVRLVNGSTGVQIGATLVGDVANDRLGDNGIGALNNNNYVIASSADDNGGIVNAGSVRLVNGSTGVQIGATLAGDVANDRLGRGGITVLSNNNYVIASPNDDEGGIVDAGSVRLANGSTGVQIGATLAGDVAGDFLGSTGITALGNNNYVIASPSDDEGGIVNAGSVRLVNGSTGVQIGATLAGDVVNDILGITNITVLGNNNYVIASPNDDDGGIVDASSVRLVNGNTGAQIGATLVGDVTGDRLGRDSIGVLSTNNSITALSNNNYVIVSPFDDEGGIVNVGSVRLVNGSTGVAMGADIVGAAVSDMRDARVINPVNGNYYILSQPIANKAGQVDAGMVQIVVP